MLQLVSVRQPCMFFLFTATSALNIELQVDWNAERVKTHTAATIEVDVMPFLGRTPFGGPFDSFYTAMADLGAEFVRYAPWFPNPKVVVTELQPSDCTSTTPATNWNATNFDAIVRDFMAAVCGPGAELGACSTGLSVVQQLSTMPVWMYTDANIDIKTFPEDPWNTTNPFDAYSRGSKLKDPSCGQMARYFARIVGWYTAGGFHDECGHWHESGYKYPWWGLSVLNEDEHHIQPDNGEAYTICYDAIVKEVGKVNPTIVPVGPEICCKGPDYLLYFLNASHHADGKAPKVSSYHQAQNAVNSSAESFFTQWDQTFHDYVMTVDTFLKTTGQDTEMVLNEYIPFVNDWCDCGDGHEHLCGGERFPDKCPNWQDPATAGGDANLQHSHGIGMNKATWSWHAAAGCFAYGYGTLAELGNYKYVGHDQLIGGTWPDNEAPVSCMDWQSGQVNAKYYVTQLLAKTVGSSKEKSIFKYTAAAKGMPFELKSATDALYAMPYRMSGSETKSILLVNKKPDVINLQLNGVKGGTATVVEVSPGDPEAALNPPLERRIGSDGSLKLGPFATAVVTTIVESSAEMLV